MANSADANSTRFLSGVLRRFVCGRSLPTYPSDDHFLDSKSFKQVDNINYKPENGFKSGYDQTKANSVETQSATPGVVARLMGLDSFPVDTKPRDKSLASYFRSRSVNSIEFLAQLDFSCKKAPAQHRRVRTAVSFQEIPSLDHLEGKHADFNVILHFEKVENPERSDIVRKRAVRNERTLEKSAGKKLEEEPKKIRVKQKKNVSRRTNVDLKERRPPKSQQYSKKKKSKFSECNPRKSCSLPVLDGSTQDYHRHNPEATPSEVSHWNKHYSSGRARVLHCDGRELSRETGVGEHEREVGKEEESSYCAKMIEKICILTEEDLKSSTWEVPSQVLKFEDFEAMCGHFGQQIFDLLLNQVVDELVLLHVGQ